MIGVITIAFGRASNGIPVGNPYIDPSQLSTNGISLYDEPWRGYMDTVPATQFLAGIGVNYNPVNESSSQDDSNLQYLASIGVHVIRIELPWNAVSPTNETQLTSGSQTKYGAIFADCKKYGIAPTILLNANDGVPEPQYTAYSATVIGTPAVGASQITVSGIPASDITVHTPNSSNGGSGLNLGIGSENGNLITAMTTNNDGSLTLSLSQPIASAPGSTVTINYFKYLPLYPVGTPEFNNTVAGWLQYVKTATNAAEAAGLTNYSVEIWNELTFGSRFLSIDGYYPSAAPLFTNVANSVQSGGSAWELANQTTQYLKNTYGSNVKVIWGFSNSNFYATASNALPPNTDGESYHPYGTQAQNLNDPGEPSILNSSSIGNLREGKYAPNIQIGLPENLFGGLDLMNNTLILGKLAPGFREASLPSGTTNFLHYITETGVEPDEMFGNQLGASNGWGQNSAINQTLQSKALLREYSFWLNKGLDQYDTYAAFSDDSENDGGYNILAGGSDVSGSPVTMESRTLQNFTSQFAGATTLSSPRSLGVTVSDITPNDNTAAYDVFSADPTTGEPALSYRDMFQFLPFQVTDHKFVIADYVMSWDLVSPPPPMDFQVDVTNVDGTNASASYYDPLTNQSEPITVISRSSTDIVLDIEAVDYPRAITIDETGATTPPVADTTPPTVSLTSPANNANVSGSSMAITANATDNVGVASVQFKLNGNNLGTPVTSSPYTQAWNTTGFSNGNYTLTAVAIDTSGNITASSPITVVVSNAGGCTQNTGEPTAASNLTETSVSNTSISLSWTAGAPSSGCTFVHYTVARSDPQSDISSIKTSFTSGTTFTDTGLTAGTTYLYYIGIEDSGINYAWTPKVAFSTTSDNLAPTVPGSFAATAPAADSVNLSWAASTDNPNPGGSGVKGYNIYRNGATSPTFVVNGANITSFTDTTVAASTTYTYVITAIDNASNESAPSSVVSVTTPAPTCSGMPSLPTTLHATAQTINSISLAWTASTASTGCTLSGYHIYRGGVFQADVTSGTSYTSTGLTPNTSYSFTVAAFDTSAHSSAQTAAVAIATTADVTAPSAPGSVTATASGSAQVNLSWTASTDNVAVTAYKIYRGGSALTTVSGSTLSYADTTVSANTDYTYQVSALDAANNESTKVTASPSPIHTPTATDITAPTTPTNLTAPIIASQSANISWTASTDNVGVAGYHIYINGIYDGDTTTTSFTAGCVAPGVNYTFTVKAFDAAGNLSPAATVNLTSLSGSLSGDLDCNGTVNATDLFTLLRNWQRTDALPVNGDVTGDAKVDATDLFDLLRNWGKSS